MTRDDALNVLRRLRAALEARGVAHAGLFGSVARNEGRARSDIDVIVTPVLGKTLDLLDLGGVQTLLEEGFDGAEVDIVIEPVREPSLRRSIDRDRAHAF